MTKSLSIVIVDDDPAMLFYMQQMCETGLPDCVVTLIEEPEDVVAHCAEHVVDCVLIDFRLPREDGIYFAERIRERFAHLPVILCTGMGDELVVKRAFQAGVSDYLPKAIITAPVIARAVSHAVALADRACIIEQQRRDIETFAYSLAHDFKQPVRQIITCAHLAGMSLSDGNVAETSKLLSFMEEAADRLDHLVDVMSDLSLLNRQPVLSPVAVAPLIRDVGSAIATYVAERKAEICVTGDLVVQANGTLLAQIVQNLIINGLKYNKAAQPRIEVTLDRTKGAGAIKVRDNGIGIEERYFDYIFQPATRLHNKNEYQGSGLGLTLARKAASLMKGEIRCRSTVGAGSEFTILMPLHQAPAIASAA